MERKRKAGGKGGDAAPHSLWREYACISTRTVEVVLPFESRENRVGKHVFPALVPMLAAIERAEGSGSSEAAYKVSERTAVRLCLPPPLSRLSWKQGSIVADGKKVQGITKTIKAKLYPAGRPVPCAGGRRRKLSARRARGLGRRVDRELKQFARRGHRATLSEESRAVVESLFERDVTLFDSAVLVSNAGREAKQQKTGILGECEKSFISGYAGTEIDLVGFDHARRCFVVVELKITAGSIEQMMKSYLASRSDKTSGFSRSTVGCYLAQTACAALMFLHTYGLTRLPRALLVICEAGGERCRAFDVSVSSMERSRFRGWMPGF